MPKYGLRTVMRLTAAVAITTVTWIVPNQRAVNYIRQARAATGITIDDEKSNSASGREYSI